MWTRWQSCGVHVQVCAVISKHYNIKSSLLLRLCSTFNPLMATGTYIVPHRTRWSWYTGRWWVGCYICFSEEGTGRDRSTPRPLLAVPIVTAHLSTSSVPITVLLCNALFLWCFNVPVKGLTLASVGWYSQLDDCQTGQAIGRKYAAWVIRRCDRGFAWCHWYEDV